LIDLKREACGLPFFYLWIVTVFLILYLMDLLKSHRTIRKYSSAVVSADILQNIIKCGVRASNTGNMQLYSVIVTLDEINKGLLAPLHFNQSMVKDAPVVLTICFDINRFYKWCTINTTKAEFSNLLWLLNGTIDASILAQNISIAAESYGLGICYLGTTLYNAPEISAVFNLPNGVIPITTLTLGYPEIVPELTDRLPFKSIVHWEKYHDFNDDQIQTIYSEKEELDSSKQFVLDNNKENLAQVYTEVRYKNADSLHFSKKILKMLMDQGFIFD
jgi:nitroreductase